MSQLRKTLGSGMILSGISLGIQVFNFFIVNFVAQQLGTAQFGQFGILQHDFMWFLFLRDFGMTHILMSLYQNKPDDDTKRNSFWAMVFLGLISSILFCIYTLSLRSSHPNFDAMWPLVFGIFFSPNILDWFFISEKKWKSLFLIKMTQFLIYAGIALWVLQNPSEHSILHLSIALNISHIIATAVALGLFPTKLFTRLQKNVFTFFIDQLNRSKNIAVGGFLNFFLMPIGFYALDFMYAGDRIIGIYNTSHRLIIILSGFLVHFLSSSIVHSQSNTKQKVSLKESLQFTLILTLPIIMAVQFLGEWGLQFLYFGLDWQVNEVNWAKQNLMFFCISIAAQAFRVNYISWYIQMDKTKHYLYIFLIAALINITVTYIGLQFGSKDYIALIVMTGEIVFSLGLWLKYVHLTRVTSTHIEDVH